MIPVFPPKQNGLDAVTSLRRWPLDGNVLLVRTLFRECIFDTDRSRLSPP